MVESGDLQCLMREFSVEIKNELSVLSKAVHESSTRLEVLYNELVHINRRYQDLKEESERTHESLWKEVNTVKDSHASLGWRVAAAIGASITAIIGVIVSWVKS